VLVGSGNPEEGELRPQLQDRFGLSVDVRTPGDVPTRVEIIRLREAFDHDRTAFRKKWARKESALRRKIQIARDQLDDVDTPAELLETAAKLCLALGTDGLRGELTLVRSARALAALEGKSAATLKHLRAMAPSVLRHRLRRDPLDESSADIRVERVIAELFQESVNDGGS
jgi:magnesium chelatase subunit I